MQGGYKAAAMSGVKDATPPPAANGTNNSNGVKKTNPKKKPAPSDKGNGKANGTEGGDAAAVSARAPPPGFAAPSTKAAPVPNAWASPLPVVAAAPVGFSDSHQRMLRHRALWAFRFLVGKAVEVSLVDNSRYVGVLDCIDPDDFSIVLKNTQKKSADGVSDTRFDSGSTVIFKRRQLAHIVADGAVSPMEGAAGTTRAPASGAPGFRTDTEISNRSHEHLFGRELESAASWLDPQLDTGDLEEPTRRKSNWNQFEVNEKLFGVVSSYDENLYTTKLDKTKISNEKSREAERLAREIERETTGNFHLQEERGQAVHGGDDLDEEAKYSSVDRKQQSQASTAARNPNAYVPPALRNASRPNSAGPTKQKPISPKTTTNTKPAATSSPATGSQPKASSTPTPTEPAPAAMVSTTPASATESTVASIVSPAGPTPTPVTGPDATRKPISFSEAVTGRPARPSPALTPAATPTTQTPPIAAKVPEKQERKSASPKKQASPKAEKPAKPTSSKSQAEKKVGAGSSEKKSGDESKTDKKAEKKAKAAKTESASKSTPPAAAPAETTPSSEVEPTSTTAAAAPAKKTTLNPKAKEFKLSASAPTFTPKFAAPPAPTQVTSSPYRQPNAGHYGHMHPPPPHPAMAGMGYAPGPEEWMYDGMMLDEGEYGAAAHAYMGYGMPMVPNPAMMQQHMYPPMMPPQQNARMGRGHGGAGGYGYNQPGMYNPRGYYGQGAVPGAVPYHGTPGAALGALQPPLPPSPAVADTEETPASPSLSASAGSSTPGSHQKVADAPSKK